MSELAHLGPPAPSPATSDDTSATHKGWRSRGYLPHCDSAGMVQHIVFGLADALPPGAKPPSAIHGDQILDRGAGECLLRQGPCAEIVERALMRDDGLLFHLLAWCVMPNHVHALIEQAAGAPLDKIVQTWKSVSAHRINAQLGRSGRLWRREYFDRFMRDDEHLAASISYIEDNPVKAGFVKDAADWQWSSARWRRAGEGAGGPR